MGLPEFVCHPSCTFFLEGGSLLLTPSYFGCPGVFQPALQQHRCYYGYFHIFIFHPGLQWSSFTQYNFQNKSPKKQHVQPAVYSRLQRCRVIASGCCLVGLSTWEHDCRRGRRQHTNLGEVQNKSDQLEGFTEFVPFCEVTNNRNNLHQPPKTQSNSLQMHTFSPLPCLRGYSQETSSHKFKFA